MHTHAVNAPQHVSQASASRCASIRKRFVSAELESGLSIYCNNTVAARFGNSFRKQFRMNVIPRTFLGVTALRAPSSNINSVALTCHGERVETSRHACPSTPARSAHSGLWGWLHGGSRSRSEGGRFGGEVEGDSVSGGDPRQRHHHAAAVEAIGSRGRGIVAVSSAAASVNDQLEESSVFQTSELDGTPHIINVPACACERCGVDFGSYSALFKHQGQEPDCKPPVCARDARS